MRDNDHDAGSQPPEATGLRHALVLFDAVIWQACAHQISPGWHALPEAEHAVTLDALLHDSLPSRAHLYPDTLEFPLRLASHLRQYAGDRTAARQLLLRIAGCPAYAPVIRRWVPSIVPEPAELVAFLHDWERHWGGCTRSAQSAGAGLPLPQSLRQGLRDAWRTFSVEALGSASRRQRSGLRDALRLLRLRPNTEAEAELFRDLAGNKQSLQRCGAAVHLALHAPMQTPQTIPVEQMLRALPDLIACGATFEYLRVQFGDPARWGPEIWPVHLFDRWLELTRLLPTSHPWSRESDARPTSPAVAIEAEATCSWLNDVFVQRAQQLSPNPTRGLIIFDNRPQWRRQRVPPGQWSYQTAGLSMLGTLLASGHATDCWRLAPVWHCAADAPTAQLLPLLGRLIERGRRWTGWRKQAAPDPPRCEGSFCCWISPEPELPTPLWQRLADRYADCWLAPGITSGPPRLERPGSYVGLSRAVIEGMLASHEEGVVWTDFVLSRPLRG